MANDPTPPPPCPETVDLDRIAQLIPGEGKRVPCSTRFLRLPELPFSNENDRKLSARIRWLVHYAERFGESVLEKLEEGRSVDLDERLEGDPLEILTGPLRGRDDPLLAEQLAEPLDSLQWQYLGSDDEATRHQAVDDLLRAWRLAVAILRRQVCFQPDSIPFLVHCTRDQKNLDETPFGKVSRHHFRTLGERNLRVLVALRSILITPDVQTVTWDLIGRRLEGTLTGNDGSLRRIRRALDRFVKPRLEELGFHFRRDPASKPWMARAGKGGITAETFRQRVDANIAELRKKKRGQGMPTELPSQKPPRRQR